MIDKPYSFRTAAFSNVIALAATGAILGVWYAAFKERELTFRIMAICLGQLAVWAAVDWALVRIKLKKERLDFSLKSDATQWAPIAGASMIVGWSALKTDFATHEGSLLILIGLLYSLWCIVLATESRHSHRKSTFVCLLLSHLIMPALIGLALAYLVNMMTAPTPEEAIQDACDNARIVIAENQCGPQSD